MDTLTELDADVGRLLVAGAALVPEDTTLGQRKLELDALAERLGQRVPAIPQLAASVSALIATKGRGLPVITAELLSLATGSSQVRAAQSKLASVEGPVTPFPVAAPLGNRCRSNLLYAIHDALEERRGNWYSPRSANWKELKFAIDRETIADIRLATSLAGALAQEFVSQEEEKLLEKGAAPQLGPALAAEIRRRFAKAGATAAARLIRVLAAIVKGAPAEEDRLLLGSALQSKEPNVQDAAFDAVADLFPNDKTFEPFVVAELGRASEAVLRCAGTYALDPALEACLSALDGNFRDAAAAGLACSRHPRVAERLLARLDAALTRRAADEVRAVLRALAPHRHPKLAPRALPLLDVYGADAGRAVAASDDEAALAALATRLAGKDESLFEPAARAAAKLGRDVAWRFLTGAFRAKDRATLLGLARITAALGVLGPNADKRWHNLLLDEVRVDPEPLAARVLLAFGRMKDRDGIATILREVGTRTNIRTELVDALAAVSDPAHFGAALELLADPPGISVSGARVIRVLARKESLPSLRAFVARNGSYRGLLGDLERRFTST